MWNYILIARINEDYIFIDLAVEVAYKNFRIIQI